MGYDDALNQKNAEFSGYYLYSIDLFEESFMDWILVDIFLSEDDCKISVWA